MNTKAASKIEITDGVSGLAEHSAVLTAAHTKNNSLVNSSKRNNAKQAF